MILAGGSGEARYSGSSGGTWIQAASTGTGILTVTGNSGGAVGPDGSNNINIVGSGGVDVAGSMGSNTLTITSSGNVPLQFNEDSGSAIPSANMIIVTGAGGLTTSGAGHTITVTAGGTLATTYTEDAGSAAPSGNYLNVLGGTGITTSGAGSTVTVSADTDVATTYTEDAGSATPSANNLNILGGTGITTSGAGSTVTVAAGSTLATTYTENSGTATPSANNLNILGASGITTSGSGATVTISPGSSIATTYTENSGTATPSANNLNIVGGNGITTSGSGATVTVTNTWPTVAKWVVDPVSGVGTSTTIASAIASAVSGETIFVRPGTYTENLTLKAGVNIVAFEGDAFLPNVTIVGKCTFTSAGSVSISNIRLQTNSDFLLAVTGSAASNVVLSNCYLNITNNTAISFTSSSSSSQIQLLSCYGNIATTGITLFVSSAAGNIICNYCQIGNSGNSSTASTISSGVFATQYSSLVNPFSTSATGTIFIDRSNVNCEPTNTTAITANGATNHVMSLSELSSGTASCISIGAAAAVTANLCQIGSTNAHAITGAGTLAYSALSLPQGGDLNPSTLNPINFYAGTVH